LKDGKELKDRKEAHSQSSTERQPSKQSQRSNPEPKIGFDEEDVMQWQKFRIPIPDRTHVLAQYYRMRVKEHVKLQESALKSLEGACPYQKDLEDFLRKVRGLPEPCQRHAQREQEEAERRARSKVEEAPPFWQAEPETIVTMLALVAKSLVNQDPFQDHPANNDVVEDLIGKTIKRPKGSKMREKVHALPVGMEYVLQHVVRSRIKIKKKKKGIEEKKATLIMEESEEEEEVEEKPMEEGTNLDGVLDGFTPRLRKFLDEDRGGPEPEALLEARGESLQRPSVLKAAVDLHGAGAHPS